jgi:virginiamycin B lyase
MNGDRDLDRVLERWLSEGTSEMPDRLFDAVTDRIERVPQARVARLHLRFFDMKRYQRFAAAGAAVLLIAIGGSAVLGRLSDRNDGVSPAPSPAPATAVPSISPAPSAGASLPPGAQIEGRIQVGQPVAPRWFAADSQSLWVHEASSLVRLDLATSAITGQVPTNPMEYGYVTTGAGAVWQTDWGRDALVRIDPVADKVVASIPLPVGSAPSGVAVTAGSVWVADEHSEAVTRIDPKTNRVVATIPVGPPSMDSGGPQYMTAGPGGVWVGVQNMASIVRIDSATNRVGLTVPLDGFVASDGAEVWIGIDAGPNGLAEVFRIDPVTGKVITTVHLDTKGVSGLAVGLGSVWVGSGGLTRIDAATGQVVGRLDLNGDGGNVTVAGGAVWVAADPYVIRISPK